jgi:hypothetical protein
MAQHLKQRIRLCDEDRQVYGGPEWLVYDQAIYDDMTHSQLNQLESAMGFSMTWLRTIGIRTGSSEGIKARAWLARQAAGNLADPSYEAFDIRPLKVTFEAAPLGGTIPDASPGSSPDELSEKPSTSSPRK